jgi:uncharacterized protein YndB with AHSA1/START domain
MSAIEQEIQIKAPASKVYAALSEQAGYRGFWNKVAEVPKEVGGEAKLQFVKDGTPIGMRFRIEELSPNERVRWTCVKHDMPSWVGTTLDWKLSSKGDATEVRFRHDGWKEGAPEPVVQGWQHFIASLKSYVETGAGQPW